MFSFRAPRRFGFLFRFTGTHFSLAVYRGKHVVPGQSVLKRFRTLRNIPDRRIPYRIPNDSDLRCRRRLEDRLALQCRAFEGETYARLTPSGIEISDKSRYSITSFSRTRRNREKESVISEIRLSNARLLRPRFPWKFGLELAETTRSSSRET